MQTLLLVGTLLSTSPVTISNLDHKNELDVLVQEQSHQAVELVIDQAKRETVDNFLLQAKLALNTSSLVAKVELKQANAAE